MANLRDTITLMTSDDYKERFCAEYWQTKIRYERLKKLNTKIEAAERSRYGDKVVNPPVHDCPANILQEQQRVMGEYLHILEVRAVLEDVDIGKGVAE